MYEPVTALPGQPEPYKVKLDPNTFLSLYVIIIDNLDEPHGSSFWK